jgi:capsular exopolysaccharide synthesis family protein
VSRVYDALRKLEEQGKESIEAPAKTLVVPPRNASQPLAAPSLQARLGPEARMVVFSDSRSAGGERFRLIRMALRSSAAGRLLKVILITSPLPKDGKSTVALNLATSLAEEGKVKVLLLEGDLRRPSLLASLGLDPANGLANVLVDHLEPASAMWKIDPLGFYLMPAGHSTENPAELFQSEGFISLIRDSKACFDWILIDCPPAYPLADVSALRAQADGVLLVARADSTPREAVQETLQLFKPGQVVGLVLNASDDVKRLYEDYYRRKIPGTPLLSGARVD